MIGSRFGQINMPAFGQGTATRRDEGVATGPGHLPEGSGAGRSEGGAGNAGSFAGGAGSAAFPLPVGVASAGHLSGNIGPAGLSASGDYGQGSGRWNQHNLANQLETIKVLILFKCFYRPLY